MDEIELMDKMRRTIRDDMGYPGMVLDEVLKKTIERIKEERGVEK